MNLRWLLFDYADPELPLTMGQRLNAAWRIIPVSRLPRSARGGRWLYAAGVCLPCFALCAFIILAPHIMRDLGFLVIPVWFIASWPWYCLMYGLTCRREHYHRLRLTGFDVCVECGYWLRDLPTGVERCPECGTEREPMPGAEQ